MNEDELAEGCRRNDNRAQRELYETYGPRILAVISRYIAEKDVAKDVFQDTFVRIFGSMGQFSWRGNGSLKAWTERVAVNMSLNYLRDHKAEQLAVQVDDSFVLADEPTAEDVDGIDASVIEGFIAELPVGYRTVFNLFCIEGLNHRQIAEKLGINEKSSSSQLSRAKALLAKRIKEYLAKKIEES